MNAEYNSRLIETCAYASNYKTLEAKVYKGRNPYLKCKYCNDVGHVEDKCWELHLELKPKLSKDGKMKPSKGHGGGSQAQGNEENNHAAMLGQFASFLAGNEKVLRDEAPGCSHHEDDW
ncbi:hypothetical protein ACFX1R_010676 [Malus domestica]